MNPGPHTTAHLDELLRYDDGPEPTPRVDTRWRWAAGTLAYAAALAGFLVVSARVLGVGLPFTVTFSAILALFVLHRVGHDLAAIRATAPPPPQDSDADWMRAWPMPDGSFAAAARWDTRLSWTQSDPERFARAVQPMLVELADERLRQRHGLTRASDPDQARELLGEPLWTFMATPVTRPLTPHQLAALVAKLEAL